MQVEDIRDILRGANVTLSTLLSPLGPAYVHLLLTDPIARAEVADLLEAVRAASKLLEEVHIDNH